MSSRRPAVLRLALALLILGGCAPGSDRAAPGGAVTGRVTVFAAASLTEPFNQLGERFREDHPAADLAFNFGASSGLAAQIIEQGGADVFASADRPNMRKVAERGLVDGEPDIFAGNRLEIIVSPGNPEGVTGLSDLGRPELKVVLAASAVPVGRYAREALSRAGVAVDPVSEAVDAKGVVGPVTLGEADAGIVYASDVKAAAPAAAGVEIPQEHNVAAEYPIARLAGAPNPRAARAFIDLVLSPEGRRVLEDRGFVAP